MSADGSDGTSGLVGRALREGSSAAAAALVQRLAALLRTAQTHGAANDAWAAQAAGLHAALTHLLRTEQEAALRAEPGHLSVNGQAVRPAATDAHVHRALADQLLARGVRGLRFRAVPPEDALVRLAVALRAHPADGSLPPAVLAARLREGGLTGVELEEAGAAAAAPAAAGVRRGRTEDAVFLFLRGIAVVREAMDGLRAGKSVGFRRARRFVQGAVDLLEEDPGLAHALTTLKNCGDYLHNHPVNVCLLSLALGRWLGLTRRELADLGLAALLRDVGKATLTPALRDKRGELTAEEWQQFQRFPHAAVAGLLRFRGFSEATLRHVLVAFEHPLRINGGRTLTGRAPGFYTKLIMLADGYDAMTTPRPYRKRPMLPAEALSTLVRERGQTGADPLLLRAFVHALGLFPVGSVVVLDSGELGVVCEPPVDAARLAAPRVRVLTDAGGRPLPRSLVTGTAAPDDAASPLPRVTRLADPWRHGLSVPHVLLGLPAHGAP